MTQPDVQHLLLIGAYRDNEVTPAHPLMRRLSAMRAANTSVQEIVWRRSAGGCWPVDWRFAAV